MHSISVSGRLGLLYNQFKISSCFYSFLFWKHCLHSKRLEAVLVQNLILTYDVFVSAGITRVSYWWWRVVFIYYSKYCLRILLFIWKEPHENSNGGLGKVLRLGAEQWWQQPKSRFWAWRVCRFGAGAKRGWIQYDERNIFIQQVSAVTCCEIVTGVVRMSLSNISLLSTTRYTWRTPTEWRKLVAELERWGQAHL